MTSQAVQFYTAAMAAGFGCPGPALSVIVESRADPIEILVERYAGDGLARMTADVIRGAGVDDRRSSPVSITGTPHPSEP